MKYVLTIALLLSFGVLGAKAQESSPTPSPTPTPAPLQGDAINEMLATADGSLVGVPTDPLQPEGVSLVPDEDGSQIYGYAKYLFSASIAAEVFGPIAPIVNHTSIYVIATIALGTIYAVIYAIMYIILWAVWLFNQVLRIITAIAAVVNGAIGAVGGIVGKVLSIFGR